MSLRLAGTDPDGEHVSQSVTLRPTPECRINLTALAVRRDGSRTTVSARDEILPALAILKEDMRADLDA